MGGVGAATAFALLLGELGLAPAIAAAFDDEDLDVVGKAVDQGDGAGCTTRKLGILPLGVLGEP